MYRDHDSGIQHIQARKDHCPELESLWSAAKRPEPPQAHYEKAQELLDYAYSVAVHRDYYGHV